MKFPELKRKAILAPMSGITDIAFRELARKYSSSLTYTEFIHSRAILNNNKKTSEMLKISKQEKPSAVQIFGNSENNILQAAKLLESRFDIIDINCSCPAYKITKTGAGSDLLKYPDKIQSLIKKLKESISIPVIGNGDISSPENFKEMLEFSKADYIMIGRASIGNPFIFQKIEDYLKTGKYREKSKEEQFEEYLKLAIKYNLPFSQIKAQSVYFTKGMEKSRQLRLKLSKASGILDVKKLFKPM